MELNPLNMIQPVVILSVIAIFVAVHFALRKSFFLPVIEVMESRQQRLDVAAAKRNEAADVERTAQEEVAGIVERSRSRAEAVSQAIRERAQGERRDRLEAARAEAATALDSGRRELAAEREAALTKLRSETSACVGLACDRLLGGVDPRTVDGIVERLVSRRVH